MLDKLARREEQITRAWVFDNYVVAKCGASLAYAKREIVTSNNKNFRCHSDRLDLRLDPSVWIENIYATGV